MHTKHLFPLGVGAVATLAVLAAAGQLPLEVFSAAAVHHVYHIVLPTAAFVMFAVFVAVDIRRHGWPTFCW
jgi:hypothetical protein